MTQPGGGVALPSNKGIVALVAANLYVIFFNGTWGPVMWVMLGEMFRTRRAVPAWRSPAAQWITDALIAVSSPGFAVSPGLAITYSGYACFALLFSSLSVHWSSRRAAANWKTWPAETGAGAKPFFRGTVRR